MLNLLTKILFYPHSLRRKFLVSALKRATFIPYSTRVALYAVNRPFYAYALWNAAKLAKSLGHKRVSAIEFGVAWGSGLLNLEMHAVEIKKNLGIEVEIYGFDTGQGLPAPEDYRDLPYIWSKNMFAMDQAALKKKLKNAHIVFGNVSETLETFLEKFDPAVIGAIIFDLDYYSSTRDAFRIFDLCRSRMLPRAYLYFDDIVGDEKTLLNEFVGEELAIFEFNHKHSDQKIAEIRHLTRGSDPDHIGVGKCFPITISDTEIIRSSLRVEHSNVPDASDIFKAGAGMKCF